MSNFSAMKKRSQSNSFEDLQKELEAQQNTKENHTDERFYYPERTKEGTGQAIIRFLPCCDGDTVPMTKKLFSHSAKMKGGYFINECPTTKGEKCPLCEANDPIWNSGDAGKAQIRSEKRSRRMRQVANILVIKDPANPENEGKHFLFQVGAKIYAKIMEAMNGIEDDLEPENSVAPCNVFDYWEGKNFTFKITKEKGETNYDKSSFQKKPTPLHTFNEAGKAQAWTDEQLEELWNKQYSLKEYVESIVYKDYDKLQERLDKVTGIKPLPKTAKKSAESSANNKGYDEEIDPVVTGAIADAGKTAEASEQSEDEFFNNL